jgi:hypothetical protein
VAPAWRGRAARSALCAATVVVLEAVIRGLAAFWIASGTRAEKPRNIQMLTWDVIV